MGRANRNLRGPGLHDPTICFDNLEPNDGGLHSSSYSQTGGRPGSPIPVDPLGTFLPHVHHAQEQDLTVLAVRAGVPTSDNGAGLGYRVHGETDEETRGWNEPNLVQGYVPVDWTTSANWTNADAVTSPRTQRVVVVGSDSTNTVGPTVWRWSPVADEWSVGTVIDTDLPSFSYQSCITILRETNRILVFNQKVGTLEPGVAQIWFSDDDADTFELYAEPELTEFGDPDIERLRIIEDIHGNLLLLGTDETTGDYWQFVSTDSGATWVVLEQGNSWGTFASMTLTATGRIVIAFIEFAGDDAAWITLDDAFDPISSKTFTEINTSDVATEAVACCTDADGIVYVAITLEANDIVRMARSADHGGTFELYEQDLLGTGGTISNPTDHRHKVKALAPSGGQLIGLFTSDHVATSPGTDGSLISLMLGGWGNVEAPTGTTGSYSSLRKSRVSWADSDDKDLHGIFLPTEILEDQGWSGSGATSSTVNGYHSFEAAAGTCFVTNTFAGHSTTPTTVMFEARVVDGGDVNNDDLCFLYVRRDGSDESRLRIRFAETGFRVRDDDSVSPSNLGTVTIDMTAQVYQFLILSGHKITQGRYTTVLYRARGSSVWIQVAQAELISTATATTTDQVRVGITSSATGDLRVGMIAWCQTDSINKFLTGLIDVSNYTTRLRWGKAVGGRPYPIRDQYDTDRNMTFLSGSGGAARLQERWQCPAEWDHGVRELFPVESPSPSATWRSVDTAEQIFAWDLGADSRLGSSWAMFAAFVGCNFQQALIEVSTDAAPDTWITLGGYNAFTDLGPSLTGVPFTRTGAVIRPGPGAAGTRYYAAGELVGGTYALSAVGPVRTIVRNSAGWLRPGGLEAVIEVEGIDGLEPTTGNGFAIANGGVLVMHQAPVVFRRIRLRIPNQETPEGYFELGKFVLGAITVIGRQYSRGFSVRYIPIVREEVDDSGTVYLDARGPDSTGSLFREHTFSYQDGYDESAIRNGTALYLSAGPAMPALAADQDVWLQLAGFLRESKGGSIPSVLFLEIPSTTTTITDPTLWSYGRLRGTLQINNVQGDEGRSQVYRVENLTHIELV